MSTNSQTHIDDASKCLNSPFLEVFPVAIISKVIDHALLAVAYYKNLQHVFLGYAFPTETQKEGERNILMSSAMQ